MTIRFRPIRTSPSGVDSRSAKLRTWYWSNRFVEPLMSTRFRVELEQYLVPYASECEGDVPEHDDAEKDERKENGYCSPYEKLNVKFDHIWFSVIR